MKKIILAIIPARGNSKEIPKKNIKPMAGKPLIYYTIKESKKSRYLTHIVVSTEDDKVACISNKFGADVIIRPKSLSRDTSSSESVILHAIKMKEKELNQKINIVVLLQPTSPLRIAQDIDKSIEMLLDTSCDLVVSVSEVNTPPQWMYRIKNDKLIPIMKGMTNAGRRQELSKVFELNGSVFAFNRDTIMKDGKIFGKDTRAYVMPKDRSVDIDSLLDFYLAEILMYKIKS